MVAATGFITDVGDHWMLYAAMPVMAALIGYVTKLVAVEMMFRPLEFKGIRPFLGWQGIVPRSVARMAAVTIDLMFGRLLDPQEVIGQIDLDKLLVEVREPMREAVDRLTGEVMTELQPAVWAALPEAGKRLLISQIESQVRPVMERLFAQMREDVEAVLDIRDLAVKALTRDKALTVKLIRTTGKAELKFIVKVGIPFGFVLGLVQALVWALTHSPWIMPAFGGMTGLVTDWLALQMIFRPVERRSFGPIGWQGLFHRRRREVEHDYAELTANEIITPANIVEALLTGPQSDRFVAVIDREVERTIDSQAGGLLKPLATLTVGSARYTAIKRKVTAQVIATMHEREDEFAVIAANAFDLSGLIREKMALMTDDEYEGLLRPAFKQDEWKLVAVGAVLGFLIGELQVHLLLS